MTPRKITAEDLREIMTDALSKKGKSAEFIEGYLEAQSLSGWLRKGCPPWIRDSAALHYLIPLHGRPPLPTTKPPMP